MDTRKVPCRIKAGCPGASIPAAALIAVLMLGSIVSVFPQMNWKKAAAPGLFSPRAAHGMPAFDNALFVFSGFTLGTANNSFRTSDGTNWTSLAGEVGFGLRGYYGCVVFKEEMWIVGGAGIEGG